MSTTVTLPGSPTATYSLLARLVSFQTTSGDPGSGSDVVDDPVVSIDDDEGTAVRRAVQALTVRHPEAMWARHGNIDRTTDR